jgi:predicted alpha/beta superfamily hydrolase
LKLHSSILSEDLNIYIALPSGYKSGDNSYPVVYVLDGESYFSIAVSAYRTLAGSNRMPRAIIIGLTSSDRFRDFTTMPGKDFDVPKEIFKNGAGGADKFLDHLESEVIPFIEKNYRVAPYRIIVGHSLGGLLAFRSMVTKPRLFQAYVNIDGSLFWDNDRVANAAIDYIKKNPDFKTHLFWVRSQMPREVWFPANIRLLETLTNSKPARMKFSLIELDQEEHSTLIYPGLYFGLRWLFSDFKMELQEATTLADITKYYDKLSDDYGYKVLIPEATLNNFTGQLLHLKKVKQAVTTAELRVQLYPKSVRALDQLGAVYEADGQSDKALKAYQSAQALSEPQDDERTTRQSKIDGLKKQTPM